MHRNEEREIKKTAIGYWDRRRKSVRGRERRSRHGGSFAACLWLFVEVGVKAKRARRRVRVPWAAAADENITRASDVSRDFRRTSVKRAIGEER